MTRSKNTHGQWQHEKILSVSARLFWAKGYLATSIDDIAEASKMNKASIYYYFTNKAAILYELASTTTQELINQALPLAKSDIRSEEKLKIFICDHVIYILKHLGFSGIGQMERRNLPPKLMRPYIELRNQYEGILRGILKDGVEKGRFRSNDIALSSLLVLGFLNSIVQWYNTGKRLSPEEIALSAYEFISKALEVEKK